MILLDSNIFICLSNGALARRSIASEVIAHSSITEVEFLGYQRITANELILLKSLFEQSIQLPLSQEVIRVVIEVRQVKSMSLGDSIIAATALTSDVPLWTANEKDFTHIKNLDVVNPLT